MLMVRAEACNSNPNCQESAAIRMRKTPTHQELLDRIARLERQLQERIDGGRARSADRLPGSIDTAADRNHDLADRLRFIETLFDTIPNPVFYKNSAGVYLGCNQSFADLILGVPQDRIIGCSLYDLPDLIPKKLADIYHETAPFPK